MSIYAILYVISAAPFFFAPVIFFKFKQRVKIMKKKTAALALSAVLLLGGGKDSLKNSLIGKMSESEFSLFINKN